MQSQIKIVIAFFLFVVLLSLPTAVNAQTATPTPPTVPTLPSVVGKPLLGGVDAQYRQVTVGGVTTIVPVFPASPATTAPRVGTVAVPMYIQKLFEATRIPISRLSKMSNAQIWTLYSQNAQRLRVDVYESDGSHFTDIIHAHRPQVGIA